MNSEKLPLTSMKEFIKEVLSKSSEKALPCNLEDKWLKLLGRDFDVLAGNEEPEHEMQSYAAAPLALICCLLAAKRKTTTVTLDPDELVKYLEIMSLEISFENLNRNTDITVKPSTLETIFEDRKVQFHVEGTTYADLLAGRLKGDLQ